MKIPSLIAATFLCALIHGLCAADAPALKDYATKKPSGEVVVTAQDHVRYVVKLKKGKDLSEAKEDEKAQWAGEAGAAMKEKGVIIGIDYAYDTLKTVWEPETRISEQLKGTPWEPAVTFLRRFHLREKWQDLILTQTGDPEATVEPLDKAKEASFSFTDNFLNDEKKLKFDGALFTSVPLGSFGVFIPSVTLNKVNTAKTSDRVDTLVFRAAIGQYANEYNAFRYGAFYATDTSFDSGQVGAEGEWELTCIKLGIGQRRPIISSEKWFCDYRLRFFLHAEAGSILEKGENAAIKGDDQFVRVGPYIQLELFPFPHFFNWRLVETTSFTDYERVLSDTKSTRLFTTKLAYELGKDRNFTLQVKYKNGREPLSATKQHSVDVGIGLKF